MKIGIRALATLSLTVALCVPSLAGAQGDNSSTDGSSTTMSLTPWRDLGPYDVVVNIADLPGANVLLVRQRERDNEGILQLVVFDGGQGQMFVEYFSSNIFSEHVTRKIQEVSYSKRTAADYWARSKEPFDHIESRKIYAYSDRGGWIHFTLGRNTNRACFIAKLGFLSETGAGAAHGPAELTAEHYDTVITLFDCSGKRTLDQVAAWLRAAKIVDSDYNRGR